MFLSFKKRNAAYEAEREIAALKEKARRREEEALLSDEKAKAKNQAMISKMRKWRDVGQSFEYLGKMMVVARLSSFSFGILYCIESPQLTARYVNAAGEFKELSFTTAETEALMGRRFEEHDAESVNSASA